MTVTVGTLRQLDIAEVTALLLQDFSERGLERSEAFAERVLRDFLARNAGHWLVARVENQPVGHLALTWGYSFSQGGVKGVVQDVFVRPDWRGRGVADALLEEAERIARLYGARRLELLTDHDNERARRVYARAGFRDLPGKFIMMKVNDDT